MTHVMNTKAEMSHENLEIFLLLCELFYLSSSFLLIQLLVLERFLLRIYFYYYCIYLNFIKFDHL